MLTTEQIFVVKKALSAQIPGDGFGQFVRDILLSKTRFNVVEQIDTTELAKALAYHFPELLADKEFRAVWDLTQG